jgi:anthranilate phosphoribosyltransferase
MKGPTEEELRLQEAFEPNIFSKPEKLIEYIAPQAPGKIKEFCVRLMRQDILNKEEAYQLGEFLFSNKPGDGARGLVASILRVRYETDDEYEGLLKALKETFDPNFFQLRAHARNLIQIADPFDGVDQTNIITPLVADYLQTLNYSVVSMVGRSSGPKLVYNLYDIAMALNIKFLSKTEDLNVPNPFGHYLNQADLSKPMDRWVDIRRQIIKRPFLATLERFVNPFQAEIMIASAFHAPYGEKMMTIAKRAGFPKIIIVRNGIEGSTAFPLKRPAKVLLSLRQKDGEYKSQEMTFDPEKFLTKTPDIEEKLERPDLKTNVELMTQYKREGKTQNPLFDERIKFTCYGLEQCLNWFKNQGDL